MIVFYNELAGVPAFYPSSVTAPGGLRAAYNAYAEKEELHTDKNRFQFNDILPKQPNEAREYADSLKAFVLPASSASSSSTSCRATASTAASASAIHARPN
jgi:hypothetical protein